MTMPPVAMTQLEVPDYEMGLRGKLLRPEKLTGSSAVAFCTIIYGLSLLDEVTDTSFSNVENGYPDASIVADENTRVTLPWRRDTDAVIGDLVDREGRPFGASPRGQLRELIARYEGRDLSPVLGFEYELWLFHADPTAAPGDLRPFGRTENAYSLTRAAEVASLAQEFIDRMEHVGAPVEAFHSELGPGFFEFAMQPQPALQAADGAARARQYLRDLCAERGLVASFMAKPFGDKSGAGGHVHSSLSSGGRNVFAAEPGTLSATAEQYLAGLLATMGDLSLLFTPFVNSFKRIDKEMFVAEYASWGDDDRSVACRVLLDSLSGARVEHRRPGADANPYIVAAGILAGGWAGIDGQLELPAAGHGTDADRLPGTLAESIDRFADRDPAASPLNPAFADAYLSTRRVELERYETWARRHITDWELSRHLEHQ